MFFRKIVYKWTFKPEKMFNNILNSLESNKIYGTFVSRKQNNLFPLELIPFKNHEKGCRAASFFSLGNSNKRAF